MIFPLNSKQLTSVLVRLTHLLAVSKLHRTALSALEEQPNPQGKQTDRGNSGVSAREKQGDAGSLLPHEADFLSTRLTRLVSVRSFSSVFSTRLARSSIISRKGSEGAWLILPQTPWFTSQGHSCGSSFQQEPRNGQN